MAFWGVELKSTKPYTHDPSVVGARLHISQATLGFGTGEGRSVVQCNVVGKSPVLLCSLLPDKAESCPLDLEFHESEQVIFSVIGARTVYLTGYYLPNSQRSMFPNDDSESFGEDVGVTESSDYNIDEDEYEDSFIDDDDDLHVSPLSSPDSKDLKKNTNKRKSDFAKPGRKRLRKKYEVSDSEDNTVTTPLIESDEDQVPISSLRRMPISKWEESRRWRQRVCRFSDDIMKKKGGKNDKENSASTLHKEAMLENGIEADSHGLLVEDIITGNQHGKVASTGNKVSIHYTGMLKTSGQVFDSSIGKNPLKFRLGEGIALDGMDRGIVGMRVGGKRRLIIPPVLGYGSEGTERVPGNSWLIMEVELLRVHKK